MPGNQIATSIKMTPSNNAPKKHKKIGMMKKEALATTHAMLNLPRTD